MSVPPGSWTLQSCPLGDSRATCRASSTAAPAPCAAVGEALSGRRSIIRSYVSPVSCHRATAGLIQASYDQPHLLLISVHGNESVSEIVVIRFDDCLAGLAGWPD